MDYHFLVTCRRCGSILLKTNSELLLIADIQMKCTKCEKIVTLPLQVKITTIKIQKKA